MEKEKEQSEGMAIDGLSKDDVADLTNAVEESIAKDEEEKKSIENENQKEFEFDNDSEEDEVEEEEEEASSEEEDDKDIQSDEEEDDDTVSDELLETAVQLGVPIVEARKLGSKLLESKVSKLQKENQKDTDDSGDFEEDDIFQNIPDLDPEEYEAPIVEGFAALKQIVKEQSETIKRLNGSLKTDNLNDRIASLGEGIKVSPEKKTQLKDKIAVLDAGYKAVGKEIDADAVFQEAANAVLLEEIQEAAKSSKQSKVAKRSKSHINRPSGNRSSVAESIDDEIAKELNSKYFKQ
jgi:hypothetical protein